MTASIEDWKGNVRTYDSWEELVEAESNGYVATVMLRKKQKKGYVYWTWTVGPYPTKREATNARNRLKTQIKRYDGSEPVEVLAYNVRPAWKDV